VQPVLDTIVRTAVTICDSYDAVILLKDGEQLRLAAHHGPMKIDFGEAPISRDWVSGRVVVDGVPVHVHDLTADGTEFPFGREVALRLDHPHRPRTVLGLPLLREGQAIGCLFLRRPEVRRFTEKQIGLLQTFADQAVIAIENTRLFEAEQQRTRELTESLEQQTATSEVLLVISRSAFDLEAVLNRLVESAARVCEADRGVILRPTGEGASYHSAASYGHTPEYLEHMKTLTFAAGRGAVSDRVLLEGKSVQIADVLIDPEWAYPESARLGNFRTILGVPILREGIPTGIFLLHRAAVRPFTEKQIKLVETFADQAVIAIENTRLFEAEQQRSRELTESLEQQTATSEVLQVISSSPGELQPVFEAMLEKAVRICSAKFGVLALSEALLPSTAHRLRMLKCGGANR
jgi:GAF domain-containing protein